MTRSAAPTLLVAIPVFVACASVARPPGGPEDHAPPEIVGISIDTNATDVTAGKIDLVFDEVIAEHPSGGGSSLQGAPTLENVVLVSPRTGTTKVSWHRNRITIEPRSGFKANTTYRITLLPGIADIRGNVRHQALSFVFSTGASVPAFSILGRVFDWQSSTLAASSTIEAIANAGTKDSLSYMAIADSLGRFDVGPLGPGKYLVRAFIDADNSRTIGPLEKWDTVTVDVVDHRPVVEMLAIQRDTAPPGIQKVDVIDSTWLRVTLDKPFDPQTMLQPVPYNPLATPQPVIVTLRAADSSVVPIAGVMTESRATALRARLDSTSRPDTTRRPAPASLFDTLSTRPPAAKPAVPPPEQVIVVHLGPGSVVRPEARYTITITGLRNLVGRSGPASYEFTVPKPPPPAAVKPPPNPTAKPPSLQ